MVKTVSRLSAEDIHLIGSASKKEKLEMYRNRMMSLHQNIVTNDQNEQMLKPNAEGPADSSKQEHQTKNEEPFEIPNQA